MFKKVLIDAWARIELPTWARTIEERAEQLEREARDLTEFLHDHRSRDSYQVSIERVYATRCSFCGFEEDRDEDGSPLCCNAAAAEEEKLKERNDARRK